MTFEEFKNHCNVDFVEEKDKTHVLVIFSEGVNQEFEKNIIFKDPSLAKDLAMWNLYNAMRKEFGCDNG